MYSKAAPSHVQRAVADPDQKPPPFAAAHPLDLLGEALRRLGGVVGGADREAVAAVRARGPCVLSNRSRGPVAFRR